MNCCQKYAVLEVTEQLLGTLQCRKLMSDVCGKTVMNPSCSPDCGPEEDGKASVAEIREVRWKVHHHCRFPSRTAASLWFVLLPK